MPRSIWHFGLFAAGLGALLVSVVMLPGSYLFAQKSQDDLAARSLSLLDDTGSVRMELSVGERGDPQVVLRDAAGIDRAVLNLEDGGPNLMLQDKSGEQRISVGLLPDGRPFLRLFDGERQVRAELSLGANGEPGLGLSDHNGSGGVWIHVGSDGNRGVELLDRQGRLRGELVLNASGELRVVGDKRLP